LELVQTGEQTFGLPAQFVVPLASKASRVPEVVTYTVPLDTVGVPNVPDADHSGWHTVGVPEQLA
jgi:hypothetical protein